MYNAFPLRALPRISRPHLKRPLRRPFVEERGEEERVEDEEAEEPQPCPPLLPQSGQTSNPTQLQAGNLARCVDKWKSITNNNFVLNIVENGYRIQFFLPLT